MSSQSEQLAITPSVINLGGRDFAFAESLTPERNVSGAIMELNPQAEYAKSGSVPLHKHGRGPFCRFRISVGKGLAGVYALVEAGTVRYIGQCIDLQRQFSVNYGNISPSACYQGGQITHCKINRQVLNVSSSGGRIDLYFHPTSLPVSSSIKKQLITRYSPSWNGRSGE